MSDPTQIGVNATWAALDRRSFLRAAGALAAVGLLPSGCGGVPPGLAPPADRALAVLSPRGYATLQAFSMRLLGPRAAEAIAAGRLDPAGAADAWVARLPAVAASLGQGLALLEWGVWPLLPKGAPFTALAGERQDRVIADLQRSRMAVKRDLYRGLKSLVVLATFPQPAARPLVGFPGPFAAGGIAVAMADLEEEPPSPLPPRCARCGAGCTSCRWASGRACACRCGSTAARSWWRAWTTTCSSRPPTSPRCRASSTPAW